MPSVADATALRSRAEVQLLNVLNQKKARSASFYLKEAQQQVDDDDSKLMMEHARIPEALPPSTEEARLVAEVRQLEDDYFIVGATDNQQPPESEEGPSQIELNDIRRRDRHMEAQMEYAAEVKAISEEVEVAIIKAADHVKEVLGIIDATLHKAKLALKNDELLLKSDNESVLSMWRDMEAVCQRRTDEIAQFAGQLDNIEQTRTQRVRLGLQRLTTILMETAHALPPEVERIIEGEAHEVNTVVICNQRVYADLVARMATANVDVFLSARLSWEEGQVRWRHLRHNDAIATFQATLNSPLFTDPKERQEVLQQIRVFQEQVHNELRLAMLEQLRDAGAALTSERAKHILDGLNSTQQYEEEKNQSFFSELRTLHEAKVYAAKTLQEALRLELHGFGALAKEGAIEDARKTLVELLSDDSMEDFFRAAGGLRAELDTLSKQLNVAELIYSSNLDPVVNCVGILLSALPLESVMEKQGKGAERKAVQATLEKIRKAAKSEIMPLLPSLQTQLAMLINLDGVGDDFKNELRDAMAQLDLIIADYGAPQGNDVSLASTGTSVAPLASSVPSSDKSVSRSPSLAVSPKAMRKNSSLATTLTSKGKTGDTLQSTVDLQAIRKVQRRVGTLLYASELPQPWQKHLHFIFDQLLMQTNANRVVDDVVARECDSLMDTRQQESRLLVEEMGKRMEKQSALLHDQVEKLTKFFLNVVLCVEESADKVQYVNLSVMDLLDTLKDTNEETLAGLELQYTQSCARLRHSPTDAVLRDEFKRSSDLLMLIEDEYRVYHKRVSLAAENNVTAIEKQKVLYLRRLCELFGLKLMGQGDDDGDFNLDHFLSAQYIEQAIDSPPVEAESSEATEATPEKPRSASPKLESTELESFKTLSGLELAISLSPSQLAHTILAQRDDEDRVEMVHQDPNSVETASEEKVVGEDGANDDAEKVFDASLLWRQAVLDKVREEFLQLTVPSDTVEDVLAIFRDAIVTKYDSDAASNAAQSIETRDERQANSSTLLEERLRIHWPRKGRLDVQFYQPRMGELQNHRQRQERHLRGVWRKVDEQQKQFFAKVDEAAAHVEQARMTQVTFQAQLPLQLSLAALQGLEGKAKKSLSVFKSEGMQMMVALRAMIENDITVLLASCQDYIRACSSQLFPDLTSCEVISGCDYHPEEIAAIEGKIATIEAQARQQISEREQRIIAVSASQDNVLNTWQAFTERYQACVQSLAMKEGLGQKFGMPRRAAQERYRSEMTRCDVRSESINTLLATLESLTSSSLDFKHPATDHDGYEITDNVVRVLMQLRAKLFHRGKYFQLLRYPSQLELKVIEFAAVSGRRGDGQQTVIRDVEVVNEEDRSSAPPFLEFADQVGAKCREETRALYQQEGKLEELPPSGVPVALKDYLSSQLDKARSFVIQQEESFREQVNEYARLMTLAPTSAVGSFTGQSKQEMRESISMISSTFESQFQSWMALKNQHTLELRPQLCSPNNANLLQELLDREAERSTATQIGLLKLRREFLDAQMRLSFAFDSGLVGLCQCLMALLDSSILSIDDLKPFSGDELPKLKRKSLKQLRKLARVNEFGDPREVKRSAADLAKLTQLGESPRFPLRSWSGIPHFSIQPFWEEVKAKIVVNDALNGSATLEAADTSIQELVCGPSPVSDGSCVALLTPAHRALVRARDAAYASYVEFCRDETELYLKILHERLEDEMKWKTSWERGIANMRQQE